MSTHRAHSAEDTNTLGGLRTRLSLTSPRGASSSVRHQAAAGFPLSGVTQLALKVLTSQVSTEGGKAKMLKTKERTPARILSRSPLSLLARISLGVGTLQQGQAWLWHCWEDTGPCGSGSCAPFSAEENRAQPVGAERCETLNSWPPWRERLLWAHHPPKCVLDPSQACGQRVLFPK